MTLGDKDDTPVHRISTHALRISDITAQDVHDHYVRVGLILPSANEKGEMQVPELPAGIVERIGAWFTRGYQPLWKEIKALRERNGELEVENKKLLAENIKYASLMREKL